MNRYQNNYKNILLSNFKIKLKCLDIVEFFLSKKL